MCEMGIKSARFSYLHPAHGYELASKKLLNAASPQPRLQPGCNRNHVLCAAYHVVPSQLLLRLLEDRRGVETHCLGNRNMTNVVLITLSHQPVLGGEDSDSCLTHQLYEDFLFVL